MAYENFTGYSETDPNGDITRTAARCTASTMRRDVNAHVGKSYGASHFGDYDHDIDFRITACDSKGEMVVWAVASSDASWAGLGAGQDCHVYDIGSANRLTLYDKGNADNDVYASVALNTTYYLTNTRVKATPLTQCKIYSEAARTTLLDTLAITPETDDYEYALCCASMKSTWNPAATISGYSENLDLNEGPAMPVLTHHYDMMRRAG